MSSSDTASRARLQAIFEPTWPKLLAYAIRRAPTVQDAEDAVAETFVVACRRLDVIPADDAALPWLYATCRRVLANQRRSSRRRLGLLERLRAFGQPAARRDTGETDDVALLALARLREQDQEVLRLVAWEGLSNTEIAVVLGISTNAVGARLHRARRRYVDALGRERAAQR